MTKPLLLFFMLILVTLHEQAAGQFPERQIPIYVNAKPHERVFKIGEPILIDIEIKNELKEEIRITTLSFSPNSWNGETLCVELPDIYRLPAMSQVYLERPKIGNPPIPISGTGWVPVPAGGSRVRTIDASKWKIVDGWSAGTYQLVVRINKIDVDKHAWINVSSDLITFEIR